MSPRCKTCTLGLGATGAPRLYCHDHNGRFCKHCVTGLCAAARRRNFKKTPAYKEKYGNIGLAKSSKQFLEERESGMASLDSRVSPYSSNSRSSGSMARLSDSRSSGSMARPLILPAGKSIFNVTPSQIRAASSSTGLPKPDTNVDYYVWKVGEYAVGPDLKYEAVPLSFGEKVFVNQLHDVDNWNRIVDIHHGTDSKTNFLIAVKEGPHKILEKFAFDRPKMSADELKNQMNNVILPLMEFQAIELHKIDKDGIAKIVEAL